MEPIQLPEPVAKRSERVANPSPTDTVLPVTRCQKTTNLASWTGGSLELWCEFSFEVRWCGR